MNNINFIPDNNLRYEDEELNNKINDYNQIYNNNFDNNLINLNDNYDNKKKAQKNKKEKPLNYLINKNKNININNFLQNDSPSYEHFNPQEIENEYDIYISKLKNQLIKERNERKKKEEEAIMIHHRLTLLKNQEQSKLLQLKKIKMHIDRIINNRIKSQEKLKEKLIEKNYNSKNKGNISWMGDNSQIKKNISCSNFSRKSNKSNNIMSSSQSNFYVSTFKNFDFEKNNDSSGKKIKEKKFEKNTIDNADLNNMNNNFNNQKNTNDNKQLLKLQLMEKIRQDEEEKKRLEEEIAKIEEEEKNILLKLENRNLNNENNFSYNIKEY